MEKTDISLERHLIFAQWMELFILCLLQYKLLLDIFIVIPSLQVWDAFHGKKSRKVIKNFVKRARENEISVVFFRTLMLFGGGRRYSYDSIHEFSWAKIKKKYQFNNLSIWGAENEKFLICCSHLIQFGASLPECRYLFLRLVLTTWEISVTYGTSGRSIQPKIKRI